MSAHQITIYRDGSMEALRVTPGAGLDLRAFGNVKAHRVSDIVFDESSQRWKIVIIGEGAMTYAVWAKIAGTQIPHHARLGTDGLLLFQEYEHAVDAEIRYFNERRIVKS